MPVLHRLLSRHIHTYHIAQSDNYTAPNRKKTLPYKKETGSNRTCSDSNTSFRSRALRVMSPARFRCAMLLAILMFQNFSI